MSIPDASTAQGSKVLFLVEDHQALRDLLITALQMRGGYVVLFASSGLEALEKMRTCRPDLLLVDYHLPDMTGLQLYERLQAHAGWPPLPTIFLSARFPFASEDGGRWAFLQKPFHLDCLLALVAHMLA